MVRPHQKIDANPTNNTKMSASLRNIHSQIDLNCLRNMDMKEHSFHTYQSLQEYPTDLLFKSGMNDDEIKKRIAFTSTIANSKDTPPCYLEESVKELEKTPVADALRVGQKNGEVKDGHHGILYALFFRTACNIIVACNKNNIAIPEDEWFLSLVRKQGESNENSYM